MEQGTDRGEDVDVYCGGGWSRSERGEKAERLLAERILFRTRVETGHPPTTVTEIWAVWLFWPRVTTQVHWPLCRPLTFTSRRPCFISSPCGFSQWISGVGRPFGR